MIKTSVQLARFMHMIIQRGRFRTPGYDYQKMRQEMLVGLEEFCPMLPQKSGAGEPGKRIFEDNLLANLYRQGAFLKNALRSEARHLFVPHLNLSYVRNPKAASTSLSYALLQAIYPELKKIDLSAVTINFLADANLKKDLTAIGKATTFFTVVRNPFARLVSVYRDFFESGSDHFIYDDYLFGVFRRDLSFKEFVDTLMVIPDKLKDQHVVSQNSFLRFYHKRSIDVQVLKLEEEHKVTAFLSDFHLILPVLNKDASDYDFRIYYDHDTLEKAYQLYATDILLFGYMEDYLALKKVVSS